MQNLFFYVNFFAMANTKAAKRALRKSLKRRIFNLRRKRAMKSAIKQFKKLIENKSLEEAKKMIPQVYKAIDKASKTGVIKKNTAARKKSRLLKLLNKTVS